MLATHNPRRTCKCTPFESDSGSACSRITFGRGVVVVVVVVVVDVVVVGLGRDVVVIRVVLLGGDGVVRMIWTGVS